MVQFANRSQEGTIALRSLNGSDYGLAKSAFAAYLNPQRSRGLPCSLTALALVVILTGADTAKPNLPGYRGDGLSGVRGDPEVELISRQETSGPPMHWSQLSLTSIPCAATDTATQ